MCDYIHSKTAEFIRRVAVEIDQRSCSMVGTLVVEEHGRALREQESFHAFMGRVFDFSRARFDEACEWDRVLVRVQLTPESFCRLIMCLVHRSCEPIWMVVRSDWRIPSKEIRNVVRIFQDLVILASEFDSSNPQTRERVQHVLVH